MTLNALRIAAAVSSVLATSYAASAQSTPPQQPATLPSTAITDLEIPEGLEARVWAQSPQLFNPTNIDVDARGRIWATEAVNYRETQSPKHALQHPNGDRVMILEDTDGDGAADSSKVFVEDKDLTSPLGIAVIGNKVFVSCSPNLIVYTDDDGDDKPDKKEIFLTGFGGFDHDHGLHAVTGFLDGRLYFNAGNCGPHQVTDHSGWKLNSGSCYIHGNLNPDNTGNRKSDDGRVWVGGIALRMNADGTMMRVIGHNFRNCYEIALDSFGNVFQTDNDDDGNQGCRASWIMEGADMGFFSADGTRTWQADRRPGQNTQAAHWHQEDPGVLPYGLVTGAGGPTGNTVYENGLLPEKYVGAFLACDAGRNWVSAYYPKANGAGIVLEREDFVYSNPNGTQYEAAVNQRKWFRPSDVMVGTDGAIYIADWFDPAVGGHDMRDKRGGGRIIRVAPKGDKTRLPKVDLASLDGQLAALNSPAVNIRHQAAVKLAESHDEQAIPRLIARLSEKKSASESARAMWILARCGDAGVKAVEQQLKSDDQARRLTAFRALRAVNANVLEHAKALAGDPSPAVRREVAVAMRDVPLKDCQDILLKLADGYDGKDRFYLEAFGEACSGKEEAIYPILLTQSGVNDPLKWSDAFTGIAWRLHPAASISAFAARAADASLSPEQRKQAVVALAFINDEKSAEAMSQLARTGPDDVRAPADWWMVNRVKNDWKELHAARHYTPSEATAEKKPDPKAMAALEKAVATITNEKATPHARTQAVNRLAADPEGGKLLIGLVAEGKFPEQFNENAAERLYKNPDVSVRALASQYFPRKAAGGNPLPPVKELAAMPGDVKRGHDVFFGAVAACAKCHKFNGEGTDVGPDLTAIRTKFQKPEILDSVLNPSAAIAFGYEPWIVKTKKNDVYSGFIIADGENITLKASSGEQHTIAAKDIVLRKKQTMSIMPDNVALGLTAQELADLAEFLMKAPVTLPATPKPAP